MTTDYEKLLGKEGPYYCDECGIGPVELALCGRRVVMMITADGKTVCFRCWKPFKQVIVGVAR